MRLTEFTTLLYILSKNKTVKLVNLIKILDKMDEFFRGVAALRGIKKFFTLASLAEFRFRK